MNAPKLVESIPTVTTPVQLSELREARRARAGVITGGVLLVLTSGLLVAAVALS